MLFKKQVKAARKQVIQLIWSHIFQNKTFNRYLMRLMHRYRAVFVESTQDEAFIFNAHVIGFLHLSNSEYFQDIWALSRCNFKSGGFFVEFGATNGRDISNTYLLEKKFGWSGILAEPNPVWHEALRANRACAISTKCVYSVSGEWVEFFAPHEAEHGGISNTIQDERHKHLHEKSNHFKVETISLHDLLVEHHAPYTIDFISIDTEGSEYEILSHFDFSKWDIRCFAVEHNFTDNEIKVHKLMKNSGYRRVLKHQSGIDAWYVKT